MVAKSLLHEGMDKSDALRLLRQGYGGKRVSDSLGVSHSQLAGLLVNDDELSYARDIGRQVLVSMREDGLRLREIADRTGWSVTALSNMLRDEGFARKDYSMRKAKEVNYWLRRKWA